MYTIFINDVPIFLTDILKNKSENMFVYKDESTIQSMLNFAKTDNAEEVYLYHSDLKFLWKSFKKYFKTNNHRHEIAAGGLIRNKDNETLFIYRLDKWDLPKGKIEKGESKKEAAIREVKEECGLQHVSIEKKLQKTYHIYHRNGKEILKITYWYLMKTSYLEKLIPQLEEDITQVVFKNEIETNKALNNTYGNIKLLFQHLAK